ncbi:CAP domain-containing protein [Sphaerotilus sp.]|uniref:CAP domain-containing protein n=1 Tax=Sphaerotilus sp. TaxID=2093942 RepID=UPI002ACEC0E8|nr:CAP domain-containing protein [Sphaerotilus sp.]MDZ7857795.1 CAP domain-containing protein [Sphaerotilus sp.]
MSMPFTLFPAARAALALSLPLWLVLAGCGGGGAAAGTGSGDGAIDGSSDFATAARTLYTALPDTSICRAGTLTAAERSGVLATVNTIRAAHGLAAVSLDTAGENEVMQAALMSVVNGQLSHTPPTTWGCYSAAGRTGAETGNLYLGGPSAFLTLAPSASILTSWLADVGSEATLGHRRWMLDPFLKQIAFGRVDVQAASGVRTTGAVLKVIYGTDGVGPVTSDYVAYPVGDYKKAYFQGNPIQSFTAIADKASRTANGLSKVDYGVATVSVVPRGGTALSVSEVSPDYVGYGVPNLLRFRAAGITAGVVHDVTVANVRVNGVLRSYSYSFRLVD